MWAELIQSISNFGDNISNIIGNIGSFFSNVGGFILSVFGFIWYGGKTLIVGIGKLLYYITGIGLFENVGNAIDNLAEYIGGPGVIFISSLMLIIIVRIIVAFVFRLLRLNIDYHSLQSQTTFRFKHGK